MCEPSAVVSGARQGAAGANDVEKNLGGVFVIQAPRGSIPSSTLVALAITAAAAAVDTAAWASEENLATSVFYISSFLA